MFSLTCRRAGTDRCLGLAGLRAGAWPAPWCARMWCLFVCKRRPHTHPVLSRSSFAQRWLWRGFAGEPGQRWGLAWWPPPLIRHVQPWRSHARSPWVRKNPEKVSWGKSHSEWEQLKNFELASRWKKIKKTTIHVGDVLLIGGFLFNPLRYYLTRNNPSFDWATQQHPDVHQISAFFFFIVPAQSPKVTKQHPLKYVLDQNYKM